MKILKLPDEYDLASDALNAGDASKSTKLDTVMNAIHKIYVS